VLASGIFSPPRGDKLIGGRRKFHRRRSLGSRGYDGKWPCDKSYDFATILERALQSTPQRRQSGREEAKRAEWLPLSASKVRALQALNYFSPTLSVSMKGFVT
jgi:hypothetical protein